MTTKNFVVKNGVTTGNITLDALTNLITTTGNVSAANLLTGGQVSATGNITGNNLSIGNIISAGGNLTAGNITTVGNANLGNIITTGLFTSSGNVSFTGSNFYLSNVSNIRIPGGVANYVLTTNGSGNVSWEPTGRGDANVAGSNTELQFNDSGNLGASANLTFNKTSNTLSTYNVNISGNFNYTGPNAFFSNVSNLRIPGGTANYVLTTDGTGNVSWQPTGRGDANVAGNNTEVQFNNNGNLGASNAFTFNTTTNALSATYFVGDGSNLTNIAGSNVTGTVANATHACTANVVTDGTQSNITAVGTLTSLSSSGNIAGANLLTGGILSANGNVSGNYILGNGAFLTGVSTNSTSILNGNSNVVVGANSNITVGVAGNANVVVFTGTGVNVTGYIDVTANLSAANANLGNAATANFFIGSGNNLSNIQGSNVTGTVANATHASTANTVVDASQPNITSLGTLTSLSITGNANVGNVNTGIVSASGNLSAANANLGNAATANFFIGNGSGLSSLTGANVTGTVANATHASTANTVVDATQSNITSVGTLTNLSISGNANVGNNVNVAGNAVITGNLVVGGNTVYINVETIRVEDPIIELGGGPNGAPLTTDDGKDRGTLLHYYAGAPVDAFMGWDASNTEFALGSNVSVTNDVVTFNTFGNLRLNGLIATAGNFSGNIVAANANLGNAVNANFFVGNGYYLTDLNVSNIGTVANANFAAYSGNITVNAQANITSLGTLTSLSVSGNANTGNVNTGIVSASGNVSAANANLGNAVTANFFIGSGNNLSNIQASNITGTISNANFAAYAGNVTVNAQSNITSVGTLTSLSVSGNANTGNVNTGIVSASGNVTAANANLGNAATANFFIGSGNNLSNIQVGNVSGLGNIATVNLDGNSSNVLYGNGVFAPAASPYGNSNVASFLASYGSNTITTTGNVSVGNIIGNGQALTGINGANVTGTVANANYAAFAGNVTIAGQSNITSLGTLSSLSVTGNSNVSNINASVISAGGNVTGANLLTGGNVSATANVIGNNINAGNLISAGGNITGSYILGNGAFLTGITTGVQDKIANGNSNVYIPTANGNVTITAVGNANIVVITGTGANVNGYLTVSGNIQSGNANLGNAATANFFIGSGNNLSNIQVANVAGLGNIATVNLDGNASNVLYGNGVFAPAASPYGNSNVASFLASYGSNTITTTGNVTVGNIIGNGQALTGLAGANVTGTVANANYAAFAGNVTIAGQANITSLGTLTSLSVSGNANTGNVNTDIVSATGNVVANNVNAGNIISAGGNVTGANLLTGGVVSAAGNVTGNFILGNGAFLTGLSVGTQPNIANGTSNVNIPTANGNVNTSVGGVANVLVITTTGANVAGTLSASGNITGNVFTGNGSGLTNLAGANVTGQVSNALVAGTVYTAAQPNITSLGTLTGLTVGPNSGVIASGNTGFLRGNSIQGRDGSQTIFLYYGNVSGAAGIVSDLTIGAGGAGNLTVANGNVAFSGANVSLGNVSNLKIDGGTFNYFLRSDGLGNVSWAAPSISPGGGVNELQFNNTGVFAGTANLLYDTTEYRLSIQNYSLIVQSLGGVSGGTTINVTNGTYVKATAAGITTWIFTFSAPSGNASGFVLELTNGGTYTMNWPLSVRWPGGVAPELTTIGVDVLVFITNDNGITWRGALSMLNSS